MAENRIVELEGRGRSLSLSMRDLAAVLFRQHRLLLVSFLLIFGVVTFYGWVAPSYEAEMKVLVRRGRLDPPVTPEATGALAFPRLDVSEEELNSEVELLRDAEILRTVALSAGLASSPGNAAGEVELARVVRTLARNLVVDPLRKTNLISVRYRSSDPQAAAGVLQALAAAYTDRHRIVQRPAGEFGFFEQQAEHYRVGLQSAEEALVRLARRRGVIWAPLERDITIQKLSDADAAYRQTKVAVTETQQRIRSLEEQLNSLPERTTTEVRISDNPQLLEQLRSTLLALELKRTELLTRYQPTYRLVAEIDEKIAQARAAIAAERLNPLREETTQKDPNREWARSELEKAQVEFSSLLARQQAAGELVSSYQAVTRQLAEDSLTQQDLLRTVKATEEKYLLYTRKQEEARIGDALDERGILNVIIAEPPRAPALPVRSAAGFAFIGLLLALTASPGLAFAADYLTPVFRTPGEVTALLALPVLASLPEGAVSRRSVEV